jgi:hypothetical protein
MLSTVPGVLFGAFARRVCLHAERLRPLAPIVRVVTATMLLITAGCGNDKFSFRGVASGQTCVAARRSEEALGGRFVRHSTPLPREEAYHEYVYAGTLYGTSVEAHIGCVETGLFKIEQVFSATYVMRTADIGAARKYYEHVVAQLTAAVGKPDRKKLSNHNSTAREEAVGEAARFVCVAKPSPGHALSAGIIETTSGPPQYQVMVVATYYLPFC